MGWRGRGPWLVRSTTRYWGYWWECYHHLQALETALVGLVEGKALHWRHEEMAVGMLLSMITYDTSPSPRTTSLWLGLLLSDQRTVRLMAYQVAAAPPAPTLVTRPWRGS